MPHTGLTTMCRVERLRRAAGYDHAFKAEETNTDTAFLLTCKQAVVKAVNE